MKVANCLARNKMERTPNLNINENEGGYDSLFARIKNSVIVPQNEHEWSVESLDSTLNSVFADYGQKAIEANNGSIYMTLSGGLDSTLALAYLRKNFPDSEIVTFTMGGYENHEDVKHARIASEKYQSNHHEIIATADDIAEAINEYQAKFPDANLEMATKYGDLDVYLLYKKIAEKNPKVVLTFEGIDELAGGYWPHRDQATEETYEKYWRKLIPDHLEPLTATAESFGINLEFPYLDERVIKQIAEIPIEQRSDFDEGKKPLRKIAREMGLPSEIIERPKEGQVGMLRRASRDLLRQ